ncbi:MAG: calcium-binding protein [Thermoleophilia bacterium]
MGRLQVVRLDGTVVGTLPASPGWPSPDLAVTVLSTAGRTWLLDVETGAQTELVARSTDVVAWSADGTRVLLRATGPDAPTPGSLGWLLARRDGTVVEVPWPSAATTEPPLATALSPDGAMLAVRTRQAIVVVATSAPFAVAAVVPVANESQEAPVFSPDGASLAFTTQSLEQCLLGVHVLDVASGSALPLTNDCLVVGTEGDDVLHVVPPALVRGLGGDDEIVVEPSPAGLALRTVVDAGSGNDVVVSLGGEADTILGGPGDDRLLAGRGDDLVLGGPGRDLIDGGRGRDVLRGGAGDDVLRGGPDAYSGTDADRLLGGSGDDVLLGGARDDVLEGALGSDRLVGGGGTDVLAGGAGPDVLRARDGERDCLAGVEPLDRVLLDPGLEALAGFAPVPVSDACRRRGDQPETLSARSSRRHAATGPPARPARLVSSRPSRAYPTARGLRSWASGWEFA